MKVLITGCRGQLGTELRLSCPDTVTAIYTDTDQLDITNQAAVMNKINEIAPDVVINAAAYTAVDKAETESEIAYQVNAAAVGYLATACKQINARFIHISTDFVFDGNNDKPYQPTDIASPLSVYGKTKYQGEQQLLNILNSQKDSFAIVRTSWVYSSHGNNFVKTMLKLMATKEQLSIVADQYGAPTWANELANVCWQLAARSELNGIYHWSDLANISWYQFAEQIQEQAIKQGLLANKIRLIPITTAEYPTVAHRPKYSVMDTSALSIQLNHQPKEWQANLATMLAQL